MTELRLADRQRTDSDARWTLGVSTACVLALGAFVAEPEGLGTLGMLGAVFTVFLAPVVAGLAGYASFSALWLHGDVLSTRSRHLHLITLLVVAVFFVGLAALWESGALAWLDD